MVYKIIILVTYMFNNESSKVDGHPNQLNWNDIIYKKKKQSL